MVSRKTLNKENLAALGADRLADLLIEVSTRNSGVKRRIRLELAGAKARWRLPRRFASGCQSRAPDPSSTGKIEGAWSKISKRSAVQFCRSPRQTLAKASN